MEADENATEHASGHRTGRGHSVSGAALVLSVVDTRTRESHLVAIETAALHRRSGRYPALCGTEVLTASLTTAPARDCQPCATHVRSSGADRRGPSRSRRSFVPWRKGPSR